MPRVLLAIPSFNDSRRLGVFLPNLGRSVHDSGLEIQIQVVDDGSTESEFLQTGRIVDFCRETFPCVLPLLRLGKNRGKGGAIYAAWSQAKETEWLAFVDADGAIPAEEVVRITRFALTQKDYDGVLASRVLMLGHKVDRTLKRHFVGRVYATLAKILVDAPVYDSQCGFKLLKKNSFDQVEPSLDCLRFGFDMELIAILLNKGFHLLEIPIRQWRDVPGTKVRLVQDSLDMFVSLLRLRKKLVQSVV